jgi:hypothetical protein
MVVLALTAMPYASSDRLLTVELNSSPTIPADDPATSEEPALKAASKLPATDSVAEEMD